MTAPAQPATVARSTPPRPPRRPSAPLRSRGAGAGLSQTRVAILLLVPALALFSVVILYPLVNSLWLGLSDRTLLSPSQSFVGLDNLREVAGGNFLSILRNTVVFTIGSTVLAFLLGLALALVLNSGVRARGFLRGVFLLPWVIPGVVVSFLWLWIFDPNYGVLNGALRVMGLIEQNVQWLGTGSSAMAGVILAKTWHSFPWIMVMLLAGLQTVPRELYEAAAVDGAAAWDRFRHVTLPQLRGIIGVVVLLEVIWNFQHFEILYVLTGGGPAGATTTFSVAVYNTAFQAYDLGRAGAIGILWMALLSVLVAVYVRFGEQEED